MKKTLLIWPLLSLNIFYLNPSSDITEKQRENTLTTFNAYAAALRQFSSGSASNLKRAELDILEFAEPNYVDGQTHFSDINLFQNKDDIYGDDDLVPWQIYLNSIRNDFKNQLEVDFDNVNVSCIQNDNIIVQFDKKMKYLGDTKTISEVALISLPADENYSPGYKIKFIYTARYYKNIANTCKDVIKVSEQDLEVEQKMRDANELFANKDYLRAKFLYEYIDNKNPGNNYVRKQIDECNQFLNQSDYISKAEGYYNKRDFLKAQFWYEKLLTEYKNELLADTIKPRIVDCKQKYIDQQYSENIKLAEAALQQNYFEDARLNFSKALVFKPGDTYTLERLEKAKEMDDNYANKQISIAINQYYASGNYGQYFNTLRKYEGYGNRKRLTTRQYYYMVMLLDLQKSDFKKQAGLTSSECRQYCRIYSKKLKDALYYETDYDLRTEAERLLSKLNNRNQF